MSMDADAVNVNTARRCTLHSNAVSIDTHPPRHAGRRAVAVGAAVLAVVLLAGCDQMKQSTAAGPDASPQPALNDPGAAGTPNGSSGSAADTLLAQAEQDVAYFLNHRREPSTNEDESAARPAPQFYGDRTVREQPSPATDSTQTSRAATTRSPDAEDAAASRPDIQWSDPVGALPDQDQRRAHADALRPRATERPPTANTPPIVQQPLYRDEPRADGRAADQNGRPAANIDRDPARSAEQPSNADPLDRALSELAGELYHDAERSDTPMRELMLIAATSLVAPDRVVHADAVSGLSDRDRELLADMQRFFADVGRQLAESEDNDQVLRSAVAQLKAALDRTPPLSIATTTLCTRVRGFGDYEPFDKLIFLAHSQQRVIVYIEVENFTSELNSNNEWVTELAQELVIYSDRDGIPVWSETWQSVVDVTRNKRHDFFTVQLVTLPKALSVGRYSLKVRMRDEKTGAVAEQSIPFEMVADPRLAAQVR